MVKCLTLSLKMSWGRFISNLDRTLIPINVVSGFLLIVGDRKNGLNGPFESFVTIFIKVTNLIQQVTDFISR